MDDLTAASDAGAAPAELAMLQAALVRAALHGEALPGGAAAATLPDRAFLPASGPVPLAADHLAPGTLDRLDDVARAAGGEDAAYLRFRPPRREGDALWLTLEVVHRESGAARAQPLGGVQIAFARTPGGWRAVDGPRAYAT